MTKPATQDLRPFRIIPAAELAELERLGHKLHFGGGQHVFREGEPADHALLLLDGRLSVAVRTAAGPRSVGDVWPGEVVGETALFNPRSTRNATVTAVVASTCLVVDEPLLGAARGSRALAAAQNHLLSTMAKRIRSTNLSIRRAWQEERAAKAARDRSPEPEQPHPSLLQRLVSIFGGGS